MEKIISVEKEYMDIPLWLKDADGDFLPMNKKLDGTLNKMLPSTLKKLREYSKKWENIQGKIEKISYKSERLPELNSEFFKLEELSKEIAVELKEQFPINYKFCYWSESKMKRIE